VVNFPRNALVSFARNGWSACAGMEWSHSSESPDKIFQSTSSAIAGVIRKNKAKIKYNSYLYLIDNDAAQAANGGALLSTTEKK